MQFFSHLETKKWSWLVALVIIVAIKLLAADPQHVEAFYSGGFYYYFAIMLRSLLGWLPLSFGDIMYLVAGAWLCWILIKNCIRLFKKKLTWAIFTGKMYNFLLTCAAIYIVFNLFWGLNYNRRGIATQLQLTNVVYDTAGLKEMQQLLLQKVNASKNVIMLQKPGYPSNKEIFKRAVRCYETASKTFPFLQYKVSSIKSSIYGWLGNYLGFTGYYNPFTGEAQVNTTVPRFLIPYITLHEMGHQLGYAKEDEANFSGYLAAANGTDTLFQYSAYLDLFVYANREVFYLDSAASVAAVKQLLPAVKEDLLEWRRFNAKYKSVVEPAISWLYGKYLQVNQQPKGLRSYNEVIATLMAYYKKYGKI
jgi:Protein of unknown function (DUF3810)